jgi:UDP-3-O-[3-hydroxymyristoyl] glucosamine N-acyltransferase
VNTDAAAGPGDVAWTKSEARAAGFGGALLICGGGAPDGAPPPPAAALAVCRRPRLAMARVIRRFFFHLTADRPATFAEPGLAAAVAANGSWVMNATIAGGVTIAPHVTVGCAGMGYERDDDGTLVGFPQVGGVIVEEDVDIAAQATVQRAAIGDTVVRRGAKVGPHVNVGHNVDVGEDALITGQCQIGGGARIGAGAVLWQSAAVANGVDVGEGATIGMGAMIRADVPAGEVWVGNPARKLR